VIASQECDVWAQFDGPVTAFLIEVARARYDTDGFIEGPIHVMVDESGEHRTGQPVVLGERPVFLPDQLSLPVHEVPHIPGPAFWPAFKQQFGSRRAISGLAELRRVIGEPPHGAPRVDWAAVHDRLGFRLPTDYRDFIDAYGPGTVGDVRIMAPGAPGDMDLFALLERKYTEVSGLERIIGEDAPFYPEPGGTVCWGETIGGWTCGWAPVSTDPDEWDVVGITPGSDLRGLRLRGGLSFSTMLKEHAARDPLDLLPPLDVSAGPVRFVPSPAS